MDASLFLTSFMYDSGLTLSLSLSHETHHYIRALRTINIREESEKLNIWVAFFNLENEHGNPPEVI